MVQSDLAVKLRQAYKHGAIAPVREWLAGQEQAYELQELNTAFWIEQGRRVVGRKIGLTAPAVQQQLGVDQPDFGILFEDMCVNDGSAVSLSALINPKIEAELAFVLKDDLLDSKIGVHNIIDATDYIAPALEIVDSRITDWNINICDTIADNASSALYVLGRNKIALTSIDLPSVSMTLYENEQSVIEGQGADCMGNPLNAMQWLANKMVQLGRPLLAGDTVLSGALGKMVTVNGASVYRADFHGLGDVSIEFTE